MAKFATLAGELVETAEQERFLRCAAALNDLEPGELTMLNVEVPADRLVTDTGKGIF